MTTKINPAESRERDDQTAALTEFELSEVTGGSQSSGAGHVQSFFNYEEGRRGKPSVVYRITAKPAWLRNLHHGNPRQWRTASRAATQGRHR
jgi:hypothetical protein